MEEAPKKKSKKIVGKVPFSVPHGLPKHPHPTPPGEPEDIITRRPDHVVRPAAVPAQLALAAHAAGLTYKPELPDAFRHAVQRQGRPGAERMMRKATTAMIKKGVRFGSGGFDPDDDDLEDTGEKELVARPYSEKELRQAFTLFDLDGNDYIDVAELQHIFAQIGEMPSDNEISAMILLCDPRGDGTVNFDDFLNIFSNPAESLRHVNLKGLKHLLPRRKVDFDVRDPLGLVLEERVRLKDISLVVVEVRKGGQAQDAGVKNGWKVITLEGQPVASEKDFEAKIKKLESGAEEEDEEEENLGIAALGGKGRGKGDPKAKAAPKSGKVDAGKYDYSIVFEVLAGADSSSSSEELEEEAEEEADEDEDEDEDAA